MLRIATTIAKLDGAPSVDEPQVAEALQYRLDTQLYSHLLA